MMDCLPSDKLLRREFRKDVAVGFGKGILYRAERTYVCSHEMDRGWRSWLRKCTRKQQRW